MPFATFSETRFPRQDGIPRDITDQWQRLAISTDQGDPVCCAPLWNMAFHDVFHPGRRIFYLASGDALILFSEFRTPAGEIYLTPIEDSWMFCQPLLGHYAPELLEEAIEIFTREYAPIFPVIVLSGIREKSVEAIRLYMLHSRRFNFFRYRRSTQCGASLEGGFDGWMGRRSANHRAKLRKASRRAASIGVTFERHQPVNPVESANVYARMLDVERQSWKGIGHCGMAESPSREFYAALLARQALDRSAYVIFARFEDRDIGFIYGGTNGSVYRGQQFSYTNEVAVLSIGNLLQMEKVRWLCELGYQRYDMGPITGPRMGYKEHWTEETRDIQSWVMRLQ